MILLVVAWLAVRTVDATTPFASLVGPRNALAVWTDGSPTPHVTVADGAGRWPTAESVFADVLDVARRHRAAPVRTPVGANS